MRNLLFAAAFLGLAGCYKVEIINVSEGGAVGQTVNTKAHTLIAGMVTLNLIDAAKLCNGKGVAKLQTQHSFIDMLVSSLTAGIYAPVSVEVTCKA